MSPSSHKYNTQDYEHADPHFGVIVKDAEGADRYGIRTTSKENLEASDALLAKLIEGAQEILDGKAQGEDVEVHGTPARLYRFPYAGFYCERR